MDNIPIGVNFRTHIDNAVAQSDVMLAIIGPGWLTAAKPDGQRRIHDPDDFVAIEIGSALRPAPQPHMNGAKPVLACGRMGWCELWTLQHRMINVAPGGLAGAPSAEMPP